MYEPEVDSPSKQSKKKKTWCGELRRLYCPRKEDKEKRKLDFAVALEEGGRDKTALRTLKF